MSSKALALKTANGELMGFLLLATEADEGDCVVMTLPAGGVQALDRPDSQAIAAVSSPVAGELRFRRNPEGIEVAAPHTIVLRALADGTFEGTIGTHALRAEWARKK